MPIYEYKCPNGHVFELFYGIHEPSPEVCPTCGEGPLRSFYWRPKGVWIWCPSCRSFMHMRGDVPGWWRDVPVDGPLTPWPAWLDEHWDELGIVTSYADLADVYEFLTPESLLTPEGNAEAFAPLPPPGGRVLDCACGTGLLAAGLAARGFTVDASDLSPEMVARARALGVAAEVRAWNDLAFAGAIPDDERREAVDESYRLVVGKLPKKHRPEGWDA